MNTSFMKKVLRLLSRLFIFVLIGIVGIVGVKTFMFTSRQVPVDAVPRTEIPDEAVDHLSTAIQFPTISRSGRIDTSAFLDLDTFLRATYPNVDTLLEFTPINLSKVYKWPGKNPKLAPVLLLGHMDVVPIEEATIEKWEHPPFSGAIADGYIWGRGTIDDKMSVIGLLEAVEALLKQDYSPERSLYLAFGHDEEIGGKDGAQSIAAHFEKQGIQFEYVLDEASMIIQDALNGLDEPLAMIGIAEKGYVTLTLTASLENGGHSSMPPKETAVGILGAALSELQDNPCPAKIEGATKEFLTYVGPEMPLLYKALFANTWLTKGLLVQQFNNDPAAAALLRTTTAPTMLRGGVKENVLPSRASAKINFRIFPGETIETVKDYVREVVNDKRVIVAESIGSFQGDPSPVSNTDAFGFQVLQKTTQEIFPTTVVAPSLVIAGTDSRHYINVCKNIYRFSPIQIKKEDLKRFHGINERLSVENFKTSIQFYQQLIQNSCK